MSTCLEEYELLGDSKYRNYVSSVDKVLRNFESTTEWADLISNLGKLNKVLSSNNKYPIIPRKITISKRLSQCMHPLLPSGVHLKALETYDIIFKCIGTKRLSKELFIFSAGLFPLFGNATINVRPSLLSIYENHFLPLKENLRPGLDGFLSGVVPGLEEGSDHFDRTMQLLDKVCEGVGETHFYGCLWHCVLNNTSIRLPAVNYVLTKFNKRLSMEDQLHIMGTNVDILVSALCASVRDSNIFVQRSTLDVLQIAFPIHESQLVCNDVMQLVTAALSVLLRRDMSLNRRLFTWLLGNEVNVTQMPSEHPLVKRASSISSMVSSEANVSIYFELYTRDILIQAVFNWLRLVKKEPQSNVTPYRILIALLDKPEIGPNIIDEIIFNVFRSLYWGVHGEVDPSVVDEVKQKNLNQKIYQELIRSANMLFGTLDPHYIWEHLGLAFEKACLLKKGSIDKNCGYKNMDSSRLTCPVRKVCIQPPDVLEVAHLLAFLLNVISVETFLEIQTEYLPDLLNHLIQTMSRYINYLNSQELWGSFNICRDIIGRIQPPLNSGQDITDLASEVGRYHSDSVSSIPKTESICQSQTSLYRDNMEDYCDDVKYHTYYDIETSVKEFLILFVKFCHVITCQALSFSEITTQESSSSQFEEIFLQLTKDHIENEEMRNSKLELMLHSCLSPSLTQSHTRSYCTDCDMSPQSNYKFLSVISDIEKWLDPFKSACNLLIDFSSFPKYLYGNKTCDISDLENGIPEWLITLAVCGCLVTPVSQKFQLTAISTFLDLIEICQNLEDPNNDSQDINTKEGVTSVVVMCLLRPHHRVFITEKTELLQYLASFLWSYVCLEDCSSPLTFQVECAKLLNQLHSISSNSGSSVVEDILCKELTASLENQNLTSLEKFSNFWHLTRELSKSFPLKSRRGYDRCCLIMMDWLSHGNKLSKVQAQNWLTHSLQQGDLSRLVDPLLLILLSSASSRVSVQHVRIHQESVGSPREDEEDIDPNARILAISSVGGNVIYHISSDPESPQKCKNPVKTRHVFAMTSIAGDNREKVVTEQSDVQEFEQPAYADKSSVASHSMSFFINPFPVSHSEDLHTSSSLSDLDKATRFSLYGSGVNTFDDVDSVSSEETENAAEAVNEYLLQAYRSRTFKDNKRESDFIPLDLSEDCISLIGDEEGSYMSKAVVFSIMNELLLEVVRQCDGNDSGIEEKTTPGDLDKESHMEGHGDQAIKSASQRRELSVHALHTHMLLYCQVCDSARIHYVFQTLKSMLTTIPHLTLYALVTKNVNSSTTCHGNEILTLLARHKNSIFGQNFHGNLSNESLTCFRSSMYLEVIISICLYYMRSYYPNLGQMRLTKEEIKGNREVQCIACEVLSTIFFELVQVVRESGSGLNNYIWDLLGKCKVQKTVLHSLVATVFNLKQKLNPLYSRSKCTFTEEIVDFNEIPQDDYQKAMMIYLIRLCSSLIQLESYLQKLNVGESTTRSTLNGIMQDAMMAGKQHFHPKLLGLKYHQGHPIHRQPMFISAIITVLKEPLLSNTHSDWLSLVTSSLPCFDSSLMQIVLTVALQLCHNLESVAISLDTRLHPVDYVITLLRSLTILCHFCVLDASSQLSNILSQPGAHSSSSVPTLSGVNASQILNNLFNVFIPALPVKDGLKEGGGANEPMSVAHRVVISNLPRIIATMALLWQNINDSFRSSVISDSRNCLDNSQNIRQHILDLLSPICHHHTHWFMAAVSVSWFESRKKDSKTIIPSPHEPQLVLVSLISSLKVLPLTTFIQTIRQVVKKPPLIQGGNQNISVEHNLLQFFYMYVKSCSSTQLSESAMAFLGLLRDSTQLTPPSQFLLLAICNEFAQKIPPFEDKKDQKDLQDISSKLIDSCVMVAGSCLVQTNWLSRSLSVKTDMLIMKSLLDSDPNLSQATSVEGSVSSLQGSSMTKNSLSLQAQYSLDALGVLAEVLAQLLDVLYSTDEKEKVIPLLTNVMNVVTPYLRNHSHLNLPCLRACSQLLANLSGYQYTRKAWKKDVFDLLVESGLFQVDLICLHYWRTIVDNLMTQDKTTFRDLMVRITLSPSSSLFSNKEQECEHRSQLLKRLAFVLFCGEVDQFKTFMPIIQERLVETLRLPQTMPGVHAQVFLCFRVLLIRTSPDQITSWWPIIITETVQVLLQLEQELLTNTEEFSSHLKTLSSLDSSWSLSSSNGLCAHGNPAWLQLYLATCKLLDMALVLPTSHLPQFQMYRWAFVGDTSMCNNNSNYVQQEVIEATEALKTNDFVPHLIRLAHLLERQISSHKDYLLCPPGSLILTASSINSIAELLPFFNGVRCQLSRNALLLGKQDVTMATILSNVESVLENDFLEPLST